MEKSHELFSRQALMFKDITLNKSIKFYGTGFVGSNLALTFSKTGFKYLFLVDPDNVKEHNLLNQCFGNKNETIGKNKALALKEFLLENKLYDLSIMDFNSTFEENYEIMPFLENDIVVIATDNIESRINILDKIILNYEKDKLELTTFIFVNTNSDVIYIAVTKGNINFFKKMKINLLKLNSENSTDGLCGEKSSYYLGNLISGYVISEIRKIDNKEFLNYTNEVLFNIRENVFNYNFKWNN